MTDEEGFSYASPEPHPLVANGSGWRIAFANGFLAGDANGAMMSTARAYRVGWKVGDLFRRLRVI